MLPMLFVLALQPQVQAVGSPTHLWDWWPENRFVETLAPCLRHDELVRSLDRLSHAHAGALTVEQVGASVQGRSIHLISLGNGPIEVLLWSQMHGDEPSATPALLDLAHFLATQREHSPISHLLSRLTLRMVPMLNPDGTELYERRNAQAIDINRDALALATPEGRLLKELRDRFEPVLGFNLHDQNRRTAAGDTGRLATNSVLAVTGDAEGTVTPGRERAMRASAAIAAILARFSPGAVARYDEEFAPRAFGDNLTAWGSPVVLIESGGVPPGVGLDTLSRLNFVALATVLQDLARNDLADHDPAIYRDLPRNSSDRWVDVALRGGLVQQPAVAVPYRSDVAFDLLRPEREASCEENQRSRSRVVEVGDARFIAAGTEPVVEGRVVMPAFVLGVEGWQARSSLGDSELGRLARHGIQRIVWRVDDRHLAEATSRAQSVGGSTEARIEPTASGDPPALSLDARGLRRLLDRLAAADGDAEPDLGELVQALRASGAELPTTRRDQLEALWSYSASEPGPPAIRPGVPASFLVVSRPTDAATADDASLRGWRLETIWLDGVALP